MLVAEGETTRYIGDVLACVAATTEEAAREAVSRIKVDYEVLSPVTDIFEALAPDAPQLTEKGNVLHGAEVRVGHAEEALERSAFVTRNRFTTQRIEHAFLEAGGHPCRTLDQGRAAGSQGLQLQPGCLRRTG